MDIEATLAAHSFPLALLVIVLATWASMRRLILPRHFNAITGAMFTGLAYLALSTGNWTGAGLYTGLAVFDLRRYLRERPRPLDGSHEAL